MSESAIIMGAESNNLLNIFSCYASEDQHWYQQLDGHLSILQQQKLIKIADESKILAGSAQREEQLKLFNNADIILLLISPDFLKSRYQDMEDVLALQKTGKVHVIPILVRPVMSTGAAFHSLRCLPTNKVPIARWTDPDEAFENVAEELLLVVNKLRESSQKNSYITHEDPPQDDPELLALVTDQSGFMDDRLESFVGREKELADIHHKIAELTAKGGYITITGQAGQGKSSMIAKLVQNSDPQKVAHHFIPLNPGPDYQVVLLRNLMARLILKYRLSSLYVSSESRPALRDFFPKVLKEIAASGGQEVIFIDGLDQLEEDATGIRDLSFLPTRLPPGIVFVLGTRPNDTLRPLELLNPHSEYQLPNMSRTDFDLILARRGVTLKPSIADRFYDAMEQNALYLDLVAKELREVEIPQPEEIIQRLSSNPQHLFALAIERLQRQTILWEKVIYPTLGILLVAREPLHRQHLAQLLGVRDHQCREGLTKLGGLVIVDGQQKCSLFHLKFRDYLREDEQAPDKEYLLSSLEETNWHKVMAEWCEGKDINCIWEEIASNWLEQERRKYAQQHYITHLYYADDHEKLFDVLDQGEFGQRKLKNDPSTLSYIQDLDLGRLAAGSNKETFEAQIERLPRLWRYTLLRCSLASSVDQYPISAFKLLVLLGRQQEALGLAELITKNEQKAQVLLEIAAQIEAKSGSQIEALKVVLRAREVAETIQRPNARDRVLCEAAHGLTQLQEWEKAWEMLGTVEDGLQQSKGLRYLANALAQKQNWDNAKRVIDCIWVSQQRGEALDDLSKALIKAHLWKQAHIVINSIWMSQQKIKALSNLLRELVQAEQKEHAEKVWIELRQVARSIHNKEQQSEDLCNMVRTLVQIQAWDWATITAYSIQNRLRKLQALCELGTALVQAQHQEEANIVWVEARQMIHNIQDKWEQTGALQDLAMALTKVQLWAEALDVINHIQAWDWTGIPAYSIQNRLRKSQALCELGTALAKAQHQEEANVMWMEASRIINSIQNREQQAEALRGLGTALAKTQQYTEALEVVNKIQGRQEQMGALRDLVMALAQASQWTEALEVTNHIMDIQQQSELLLELGTMLAQTQQWREASAIWVEIRKALNHILNGPRQARLLRELGKALAQAQQWTEALDVINTISSREQQAVVLQELVMALIYVKQWEKAKKVIKDIQHSKIHIDLVCALGIALAQAQQWQKANTIWTEARDGINSIQDREQQARALRKLGMSLAQAQCQKEANVVWAETRKVIDGIQNKDMQTQALRELVRALVQTQQWTVAKEVINTIPNREQQAKTLQELVRVLAQAQRWEEAREMTNSIQQTWQQIQALRELVRALAQTQQWTEARDVINTIPHREQKAAALRELVVALTQAQQWEKAREVVNSIQEAWQHTQALQELDIALIQYQQTKDFNKSFNSIPANEQQAEIHEMIDSSQNRGQQGQALRELGRPIVQARKWAEDREAIGSIQQAWLHTETRADAIRLLLLVTDLVTYRPSLGTPFSKSFTWVDQFMSGGTSNP